MRIKGPKQVSMACFARLHSGAVPDGSTKIEMLWEVIKKPINASPDVKLQGVKRNLTHFMMAEAHQDAAGAQEKQNNSWRIKANLSK